MEISRGSGNPVFFVSTPIRNNSQIIGSLTYVTSISQFNERFVSPVQVGKTSAVIIYDNKGIILAHPDPERIMESTIEDIGGGEYLLSGEEVSSYGTIEPSRG